MAVDNSIVEEIRYRSDIVEVISSYVNLKRAGVNYNGLCPFHSEKSPSFTVFPATRSFYCFGCGAGGDVLSFVMRAENLDFPAALEMLARRAGIDYHPDSGDASLAHKRKRTLEMNREAARFYHNCLMQGGVGLDYLTKKRGLSPAVIRHFGLGFAPDGFGALTDRLTRLGYTEDEQIEGYLARRSEKTGRLYDLFRNRVMFPIIDVAGNVVAFGGRVMDDSKPKYLNSSDTPAFHKSRILYALNYAKNHAEKGLVLCEGYMDVIAMHAAGFPQAVATLGTAITSEHARLFRHYTDHVIISYDADEAGQRAAQKALSILEAAGVEARVLRMEGAKDPDEYIKTYGAARFGQLLDNSASRFDYIFGQILKRHDIGILEEKIKAAAEAAAFIAQVNSSVEAELYLRRVSQKLEIPEETLRADVRRLRKREERTRQREETASFMQRSAGIGDRLNPDKLKNARAAGAEEAILGLLLCYPELLREARGGSEPLCADDFVTALNRRIYTVLTEQCADGEAFSDAVLSQYLSPEEMGYITKLKLSRTELLKNDGTVLADCIKTLRSSKSNDNLEDILNDKRRKANPRSTGNSQ